MYEDNTEHHTRVPDSHQECVALGSQAYAVGQSDVLFGEILLAPHVEDERLGIVFTPGESCSENCVCVHRFHLHLMLLRLWHPPFYCTSPEFKLH